MDSQAVAQMHRPQGMPFRCNKIGHVALYVKDLEHSAKFYTEVMGFSVSDAYGSGMMPGGAVFLRCSADHHGIYKEPTFQSVLLRQLLRTRPHVSPADLAQATGS